MPRKDYLRLDISKIISDIGKNWTSEDDKIIKRQTTNFKISEVHQGKKASDESKLKMSIAHKGRKYKPTSEETKKKISISNKGNKYNLGIPLSEERKKNISLSKLGKTKTEEQKKAISLRMKGTKLSNEHKKKIALANSGIPLSKERKEKIALVHKGKIIPDDVKAKISKALMGRIISEETKVKRQITRSEKTAVFYKDTRYLSLSDACRKLNISKYLLKKELKDNEYLS